MNSRQVIDNLKNIRKDNGVEFNILMKSFMFDRFITRLSKSIYRDNFVIKGGFLLSTLFGIENRSTMDIDASFKDSDFTIENLKKIIIEIISIDLNDNIFFEISDIRNIRDEDEYGGFRFIFNYTFENIKDKLIFDIATGDPITPNAISYNYIPILSKNKINIWTYNIETVLAEKIESVFSKLETSSRMKDYYDLYLIYLRYNNSIDVSNFKLAIKNTFSKRNFKCNFRKSLLIIKESDILKYKWNAYSRKNKYATNIYFDEIILIIEKYINLIE